MSGAEPFGVMVIDDNDLIGEAIERWAARHPEIRWLGWTDDAEAAPDLVARRHPAVVLLDIDMPGSDTFALVGRIKAQCPPVQVVMFSGHLREQYIDRAADAGASGYITKDDPPREIIALARRAAAGEFVLSASAQALARRRAAPGN